MGKLMTEVLKMMKIVTFIRIRVPGKSPPLEFDKKICPGARDSAVFENLPRGNGNAWN